LCIPAAINPLKSIELAAAMPATFHLANSRYSKLFSPEEEFYYRGYQGEYTFAKKASKHGKRWTDEEENQVMKIYTGGLPLKEIAKKLGRGEKAIRLKLISIGLLSDEDMF
jgi:DNA-binding NarL/FixJ family response regulator